MTSKFKIGDRVRCIDGTFPADQEFTVRATYGHDGVYLCEFPTTWYYDTRFVLVTASDPLANVEVGDIVTVTFPVGHTSSSVTGITGVVGVVRSKLAANPDVKVSVQKVEKPLAVGDVVTWGAGVVNYRIVAIDGPHAALVCTGGPGRSWREVSGLRRANQPPH